MGGESKPLTISAKLSNSVKTRFTRITVCVPDEVVAVNVSVHGALEFTQF